MQKKDEKEKGKKGTVHAKEGGKREERNTRKRGKGKKKTPKIHASSSEDHQMGWRPFVENVMQRDARAHEPGGGVGQGRHRTRDV